MRGLRRSLFAGLLRTFARTRFVIRPETLRRRRCGQKVARGSAPWRRREGLLGKTCRQEFRGRSRSEVQENSEQFDRLCRFAQRSQVTLVFSARNEQHNDAVALRIFFSVRQAKSLTISGSSRRADTFTRATVTGNVKRRGPALPGLR